LCRPAFWVTVAAAAAESTEWRVVHVHQKRVWMSMGAHTLLACRWIGESGKETYQEALTNKGYWTNLHLSGTKIHHEVA
jgi:hypothetical protein